MFGVDYLSRDIQYENVMQMRYIWEFFSYRYFEGVTNIRCKRHISIFANARYFIIRVRDILWCDLGESVRKSNMWHFSFLFD